MTPCKINNSSEQLYVYDLQIKRFTTKNTITTFVARAPSRRTPGRCHRSHLPLRTFPASPADSTNCTERRRNNRAWTEQAHKKGSRLYRALYSLLPDPIRFLFQQEYQPNSSQGLKADPSHSADSLLQGDMLLLDRVQQQGVPATYCRDQPRPTAL